MQKHVKKLIMDRNTKITGIIHIFASFNNTIITLSDPLGNVLTWISSGNSGFKGSKRSTAYAAQITSLSMVKQIRALNIKVISIKLQGPGNGREAAVRGLVSSGINITSIKDVTPIPHNGCRTPKKRRI